MRTGLLILIIFLIGFLLFIYACVTAAGRADEQMEQYMEKHSGMPDLSPGAGKDPEEEEG